MYHHYRRSIHNISFQFFYDAPALVIIGKLISCRRSTDNNPDPTCVNQSSVTTLLLSSHAETQRGVTCDRERDARRFDVHGEEWEAHRTFWWAVNFCSQGVKTTSNQREVRRGRATKAKKKGPRRRRRWEKQIGDHLLGLIDGDFWEKKKGKEEWGGSRWSYNVDEVT